MNQKSNPLLPLFGLIILILLGVIAYLLWFKNGVPAAPLTATSTPAAVAPAAEPVHITDHAQYYDVDAVYPGGTALAASAGATPDAKAVTVMKTFETNTIEAFKENGNFANITANDIQMQGLDQGRKYSLSITYDTHQSPHTLSYVYTIYQDTLGAHPNGSYRTFTFDTASGESLEIGDLFTPGTNYLAKLSALSRAGLPAVVSKQEGSPADTSYISQGTTPDADNFTNWYLDSTNLVLIFPPYQVGPYSLGTVTLKIPRSQLDSVLKARYQ